MSQSAKLSEAFGREMKSAIDPKNERTHPALRSFEDLTTQLGELLDAEYKEFCNRCDGSRAPWSRERFYGSYLSTLANAANKAFSKRG